MVTSQEGGTTAWLRARNDRTALRVLIEQGPLTRTRLGQLTGVTKPTATQMIERLQRAGLITGAGRVQNTRGPSAESYRVRAEWVTGVAVSITAERVESVLVDVAGGQYPVSSVERPRAREQERTPEHTHERAHGPTHALEDVPTHDARTPEQIVLDAIEAACEAAGVASSNVRSVVVGVQAAVADDSDALTLGSGLDGWPERGARTRISEALGIDVVLENDVNLATMAERAVGAGSEPSSFVLLWLGVGIGIGIDLRGAVHRGSNGSAGEIGYLPIPTDVGEPDDVDVTDLLGGVTVLGLLGLPHDADYAAHVGSVSGNTGVLEVLAERIVLALEPVQAVLDPAMVVLGGPTGRAGGEMLASLVTARMHDTVPNAPLIVPSGVTENGVLVGGQHVLRAFLQERLEAEIPSE